jgi:hypothetical protein
MSVIMLADVQVLGNEQIIIKMTLVESMNKRHIPEAQTVGIAYQHGIKATPPSIEPHPLLYKVIMNHVLT